ncbi:MAG TPA: GDSL-type esterase/lipase family protein [Acidimicrobiia bacterium]|nr:GDSL-type esterase/lipase family protein [Acidimicrobiia bacterium]
MRLSIITLVALCLVLAWGALPVSAEAPEGPAVVAVGDSITAGEGASNPAVIGYAPRFQRGLIPIDCNENKASACPFLDLVNYAEMGGITSGDVVAEQLTPAVDEILRRRFDGDVTNDVEYIVVSVGGNDVFGPVLAACAAGVDQQCIDTITAVFASYQTNLGIILGTLSAAAPEAQIGIMTYYNPLGSCVLAHLEPLGEIVLEGGDVLPAGLNDVIRAFAGAFPNVTAVETHGLLEPGDLVGGSDCRHPDNSGHRKIADAFLAALV